MLEGAFARNDLLHIDYDIEEVLLLGDWAWEWHNEWSTQRRRENGEVFSLYIRGAQLFRRQASGEWQVARYIANTVPVDGDVEEHKRLIRTSKR